MSEVEFIYPKNPHVFEIVKSNTKRSLALDKIRGEKGCCKWCTGKIENNRKKYCSEDCKQSAWAFFYPQKYAYQFLIKRQSGCCAHCAYDFKSGIKKWHYGQGGYDIVDQGDVDHIIPIHKGGEILGIENHQLLCRECHIKKSASERRKNNAPACS